jgi:hypothetical protein
MRDNAPLGLSETNCLLALQSVREKALGSGGPWFSEKNVTPFLLIESSSPHGSGKGAGKGESTFSSLPHREEHRNAYQVSGQVWQG